MQAANQGNFQALLDGSDLVLVDCWASWCGACREFAPVFRDAAGRHPDATFCQLDTQTETELVEAYGIDHIPTLMLFREGLLLFKQAGYFDREGLDDILAQARALDMEVVRAEIAADHGNSGPAPGASAEDVG